MDPGNWSTNLAGGSAFGYDLLCVIVFANFVGACFQHLAVRLGVATSLDLAQACRARYHPAVNRALWLVCEISILATDLAEVLGSAIAFRILLGIPLAAGVVINVADVLIFLMLQGQRARVVESLILCLILLIIACLVFALVKTRAPALSVVSGLVPRARIVTNSAELYAAIGILGATVMPHNLFLHSSIILSRTFDKDVDGRRQAVTYGTIDSTVSLVGATFINAAILIVAAGVFAGKIGEVADLGQAAELLRPALGGAASTLFGVALLASGQQSTLTCTLAGQVVLEGFLAPAVSLKPWARRLATRLVAIVPALVVAASSGAGGVTRLLNLSQVILSLALPFAMFPLVHFCSTRQLMGELVAPRTLQAVAWLLWAGISALNVKLVIDFASGDGT
jgi:manganese transport protein